MGILWISRLSFAVFAVLVLLSGTIMVGGAWPAAAQEGPTVSVTPSSAGPAEAVTVTGTAWPPGANVTAQLREESDLSGPSAALGSSVQVDADGNFSLAGLVPRVLFGSGNRGNLTITPGTYSIVVSSGPSVTATVPFTVTAPAQTGLIWGVAYFDTNGNSQLDAGDVPAVGLGLTATNQMPGSPTIHVISDARGRYVVSPAPAGSYTLQASGQYQSTPWAGTTTVAVATGQAAQVNLALHPQSAGPPTDERYFDQTGYRIENDAIWTYFRSRGGIDTFGYPVSRTFRFLGFTVQVFQRHVLQVWADGSVHPMNLLDPDLMPVTTVNGATFPAHDPSVATAAPPPDTSNYGQAVTDFLEQVVPDHWSGQPVNFHQRYLAAAPPVGDYPPLAALEVWGFPTSQPSRDPNNNSFIYQRLQRGILHYDATTGFTGGILLADAFKSVLTGQQQPPDLRAQMAGSRFQDQYCPGEPNWVCRAAELPDTDLTLAFQPLR